VARLNKSGVGRIEFTGMRSADEQLLGEIEAVYRAKFADFVAVAASVVGDRDAAREAVQDAFAGLVRGRRKFRGDAPVEAWAWRAVVNAARRKRWSYARESRARAAAASSNGSVPPAEANSELAVLVAALPERQRLALFLRYYADLDYRQIAAVLGVEVGTVSASLHAALKALRRALEQARR
jgi:RNA polymerase sigma factor (sigma-70 family)